MSRSVHLQSVGASDEWYTPPEIFAALAVTFDLDPASPGLGCCHVPARSVYTKKDDGLSRPWSGFIWLNPPFGGRNGVAPWLQQFLRHDNGIMLVNALTSAGWFQTFATRADSMCFPRGKTKFLRPDGSRGKSPANGVALLGVGERANSALASCGLGFFVDNRRSRHEPF